MAQLVDALVLNTRAARQCGFESHPGHNGTHHSGGRRVGIVTTGGASVDPIDIDALVARAAEARELAYAPYSGFLMGAAALAGSGRVFQGALVENVSLGLAMCPERVAMFSAVAAADPDIVAVVLVAERTDGEITMPCGACCQVALELGGPEVRVAAADPSGALTETTIGQLLPRGPHKTG